MTRMIWRWSNPVPQAEPGTKKWQHTCAQLAHYGLYAIMFAMPITGYTMSVAGGHEVDMFGIAVPSVMPNNHDLASLAHSAHGWISYAMIGLVGLHVVAALWHHLIRKDRTLTRMIRG
jgi:cytochrome b561